MEPETNITGAIEGEVTDPGKLAPETITELSNGRGEE